MYAVGSRRWMGRVPMLMVRDVGGGKRYGKKGETMLVSVAN